MAKRKSSAGAKLAGSILAAPFTIAVGIAKAAEKAEKQAAKEQRAREIAERKRQAAIAKAEREQKRLAAEKEQQRKQAAKLKEQEEAAAARLKTAYAALEDRYAAAISRHQDLVKIIKEERMTEKPDYNAIITYCKEDADIIPLLYDYQLRNNLIRGWGEIDRSYDTYLWLSDAYEHLGKYDHAILACQQAIEMGIAAVHETDMEARITKLREIKKAG